MPRDHYKVHARVPLPPGTPGRHPLAIERTENFRTHGDAEVTKLSRPLHTRTLDERAVFALPTEDIDSPSTRPRRRCGRRADDTERRRDPRREHRPGPRGRH